MIKMIISGLLMLNVVFLSAQYHISGIILDDSNDAPIELAHVFIANSQIGVVSGDNGFFELKNIEKGQFELIISFLGYQPMSMPIRVGVQPLNKIVIRLKPTPKLLSSVEVVGVGSRKRKRYLRKFTKAILGRTPHAKKCKIINPEVISVFKEGNELKATASDLIEIENLATGYKMLFLLESFSKQKSKVSYSGKPIFIPLDAPSEKVAQTWEKNRHIAFNGSLRHFLSSLAIGNSRKEGFRAYKASKQAGGTIKQGGFAGLKYLVKPSAAVGLYQLSFSDMLKVVYLNEVDGITSSSVATLGGESPSSGQPSESISIQQLANEMESQRKPQTSYLFARKPNILFDRYGYVKQPQLLIEYNYWTYEGLADIVPREFGVEPMEKIVDSIPPSKKGFVLDNLLIPLEEMHDGGPPKDGIPSIDFPKFLKADSVDFLKDDDRVIGVMIGRMARAYPIKILDFHEIVNDKIAGKSYTITWCPLCGSGIVFGHGKLKRSFGVSGLLYNSDVLLYDRETNSLWSQIQGQSVAGPLSGTTLSIHPSIITTWGKWKKLHRSTLVLSNETGVYKNYDQVAYQSYLKSDRLMFPVANEDKRLPNKARVLGIIIDGKYKAYPFSVLAKKTSPIKDFFNGKDILIHFDATSQTVLVGAIGGEQIDNFTLFWFAWYAFHPETAVFE